MRRFFFLIFCILIVQNSFAQKGSDDSVYTSVDKMPEYPGGQGALLRYLQTNLKYPEVDKEDNIQGKVIATFIIDKNGKTQNVRITRSIGTTWKKHLVEIIKKMPAWIPGTLNGKKVNVEYKLPVTIHPRE